MLSYLNAQERAELDRLLASEPVSFGGWLQTVTPTFTWGWPYLAHIRQHLDRVTSGEIKRLILTVPPRHGKTEMTTVRYPVWRLERNPELRVIVGAYNQILANKFSRKARRIAVQRMPLSNDRVAVEDWETGRGGGIRAVGVGSGITGVGADLLIVDDPTKSREEAESETYRERCWDWYTDDLYTRLEPGGAVILIMTRWHADDLAGRILASEDAPNWTVVNLPAIAEENDPLGRELGQALCPERFDEEALAGIKTVLGSYSFNALYQGKPSAREGGMFKRAWLQIVKASPVEGTRVRYWDKAGTAGGGARTAGVLMSKSAEGIFYVEDVVKGQWSAGEREAVIKQTTQLDGQKYGGRVETWVEQEPGSGGKESAEATIRNLAGYIVRAENVTGSKEVRAEPYAAQCEAGNVRLIEGPWNASYIEELASFPTGAFLDQCDASSGAFNKLAVGGWYFA